MNTLAVILARAGSIGLPNKHLLPLLGRPVISHTFDHAVAAARVSRVIVTTDCPTIRSLARAAGLDAIDRPAALATNEACVQDVMLHAMDAAEADGDFQADAIVVLYGNVATRPAGMIDRCIDLLARTGCDSVRTFAPVGKWHPAWMHRLIDNGGEGRVQQVQPSSIHRRQDMEPLWLHDGGCLAVSRASMLRGRAMPTDPHAFFGVDRRGVAVEQGDCIEIDHRRDLYWAEAALRDCPSFETRLAG